MKILILILSLQSILSTIFINNFDDIEIFNGENEYIYEVLDFKPQKDKIPYFLFKFKQIYDVKFKIKFGNSTNCISLPTKYNEWVKYPLRDINETNFNVTFIILSWAFSPFIMTFIDTSKEINTNLNKFLNLNLNISGLEKSTYPLEFILDKIQSNTSFLIKSNYNNDIYDFQDYQFNYCIIEKEKDECIYIGVNNSQINFLKGEEYKIKLNWYQSNNSYYLENFEISNFVQDVEFGKNLYIKSNRFKSQYYILNIKNYSKFYLYVNKSKSFGIISISELEKEAYIKNIDNYENNFDEYDTFKLIEISKKETDEYLIIKINDKNVFYYDSNYYEGIIYIFNYTHRIKDYYGGIEQIELEKGTNAIFIWEKVCDNNLLVSSNKNMELINYLHEIDYDIYIKQNYIFLMTSYSYFIYINSSKSNTILSFYYYGLNKLINQIYWTFINSNDLLKYFRKYSFYYSTFFIDSCFIRTFSHIFKLGFNNTYFFDINEQYYFYYKKVFGNMNYYINKKILDISTDINEYKKAIREYDSENFKNINNKLIIISGYKLLSCFISYNTLFEFYIQKVNDLEHIKIYEKYSNLNTINAKLLNANKVYYLDFEVNHLIKLDSKFLNSTVIFKDEKGKKFILNNSKRVIKDLKGNNIVVKSNKIALIYFYKKIANFSESNVIEFDKSQKRKIMKFNITCLESFINIHYYYNSLRINIIKDFSFKGYYPLISSDMIEKIYLSKYHSNTIYIENYYDLLGNNNELYENEGEKYILYFYDLLGSNESSNQYFNITKPIYVDNLYTIGNKYNFEVIPPDTNGVLLLNPIKKNKIKYQFFICKNEEIKFTIYNLNDIVSDSIFKDDKQPYNIIINRNRMITLDFNKYGTLVHSFESSHEFLFMYSLYSFEDLNGLKKEPINNNFILINQISKYNIQLIFYPKYISDLVQYHIVIAKKDKLNNINSFSDECHIGKLMINNDDSILVKSIYIKTDKLIIEDIDLSKFDLKDNNELVINIISYNVLLYCFNFYTPKEFKIQENEAKEFKLGENVDFNFINNNYFKFKYEKDINKNLTIYFNFDTNQDFYIIFYKEGEKAQIMQNNKEKIFELNLNESGLYYLSFYSFNEISEKNYIFYTFIPGKLIDTIDLSQKMYIKKIKMKLNNCYESNYYRVNNIKRDTYVYFNYRIESNINEKEDIYFFFTKPFTICKNIKDDCISDIMSYHFLKKESYTIYINLVHKIEGDLWKNYYYPSFIFFPIFEDTIEDIRKGIYSFSVPKIYNIDSTYQKEIYILKNNKNNILYYEYGDEKASYTNLNTLLSLKEAMEIQKINKSGGKYLILVALPISDNNLISIVDQIINENISISDNYLIETGKNALIYKNNKKDNKNILTTFFSTIKNMRIINGVNINEKYDYLIQNSLPLLIYVDEYIKDINITIREYKSNYNFFGIFNNDSLKNYIPLIRDYLHSYNITFEENTPINFRININNNIIYKLFNLYFFNIDSNIIFYIKKIYGDVELYECEPESDIINNLTKLTMPLSYCKNKKSLFNKIIKLSGTKLITGFLEYNSYLDIYFEIDNYSTKINLPNIVFNNTKFLHTAKYLKKNIEYKLDFLADHLIKLEPDFQAEVYIYNQEKIISILNSTHLTYKIKGNNFKIKSNNNTMVYFFAKKPSYIQQIKIDPKQKRRNYEIISSSYNFDIGFKDYNTLNIFELIYNKKPEIIYIENIYDKLKDNLIEGEYIYLYANTNEEIEINYSAINLNYPNNDYNFYFIKKNKKNYANIKQEQKYSLILKNKNKQRVKYKIYFCSPYVQTTIEMRHESPNNPNGFPVFFNKLENEITDYLNIGTSQLRFYSDVDYVFSYSFTDFNDYYIKGRKELVDLKINDVKTTNINNIITINFNPNYLNSTTRYFIIIAQKDENNTLENFTNPCYLTQMVLEQKINAKIIVIYNIGENNTINVDVNISEIFNPFNDYIINIISQELRYERNLNFYFPKLFKYEIIEKKGTGISYIFLIISCVIILLMILFIIHRFFKKKEQNIDFNRGINNVNKKHLLPEMELVNKY